MRWSCAALLLLATLAAIACAVGSAAAERSTTAADLQPFVPSPGFFPILSWDRLHGWQPPFRNPKHGLESIAECNFTVAGFVGPEDLPRCEKLGLSAILALPPGEEPGGQSWLKLSDAEIDRRIKAMVEKAGGSKAVLGYFIMDEPGAVAFPALAKAVAAVKKYAPGKLAYINLFPWGATVGPPGKSQLETATYAEYLERFVNEVKPQIISYDNYAVEYSGDLQDGQIAAAYYVNLLEVRRVAEKYRLPFWNIVCCNQIRPQTTIPSPANLAFQAYTTLAAGGQGVSWYKYYADGYAYAPIDAAGEKTDSWRYLQTVNRHVRTLGPVLNRLHSTGVFFVWPPVKPLPLLPGRVVKQVLATVSGHAATGRPPVMIGEFTDQQGGDYVMLVNLSLEKSANVKLETAKPYRTKQLFSAEDGRLLPLDETLGHWLPAGAGVLIKLTEATGGKTAANSQ